MGKKLLKNWKVYPLTTKDTPKMGLSRKVNSKFVNKKRRDAFIASLHLEEFHTYLRENPKLTQHAPLNLIKLIVATFLMAHTGLRINEVRLMQYQSLLNLINFGYTTVSNVKRIGEREVALAEVHRQRLKDLIFTHPEPGRPPSIFPNNKMPQRDFYILGVKDYRKPVSERYFNTLVSKHLKGFASYLLNEKQSVPELFQWTSHSFRSGYITELYEKGASPSDIQRLVGHTDISTTLRYSEHLNRGTSKVSFLNKYADIPYLGGQK